jgi:hypothetical protein
MPWSGHGFNIQFNEETTQCVEDRNRIAGWLDGWGKFQKYCASFLRNFVIRVAHVRLYYGNTGTCGLGDFSG